MTMAELLNQSFRGDGEGSIQSRREKIMAALKGQYEPDDDDDGEMVGFLGKINERVRENLKKRGRKVSKPSKPKAKAKVANAAVPFMEDGDLTKGLEEVRVCEDERARARPSFLSHEHRSLRSSVRGARVAHDSGGELGFRLGEGVRRFGPRVERVGSS